MIGVGRKPRKRWPLYLCIGLVLLIIFLCYFLFASGFFNVKSVVIEHTGETQASYKLSNSDISDIMDIARDENLLTMDKSVYEARINESPYLDCAGIYRSFPDKLIVRVRERVPSAILIFQGEHYLIDEEGVVLKKVQTSDYGCMIVSGLSARNISLGSVINPQNKEQLAALITVLGELKTWRYSQHISEINVSSLESIMLVVDTKTIVKLGDSEDMHSKIGSLCAFLPQMENKDGVLDLSNPGEGTFIPN